MTITFSPQQKRIEIYDGSLLKASIYESALMGRLSMMLSEYEPLQEGVDFQRLPHEIYGKGTGNQAGGGILSALVYNVSPKPIEWSFDPENHQGGVSYFDKKPYTVIAFDRQQYKEANPQLLLLKNNQQEWAFSFHLEWRDDNHFQYEESYYQKMHHMSLVLNAMLDAYGPAQPTLVLPFLEGLNVFGRHPWDSTLEQIIHAIVPTLSPEDWEPYMQSTTQPVVEVPIYLGPVL